MEGMELPVDLVDYVQSMLSERVPLKRIAVALNISDPRSLKRLMTKALGREFRVFDKFTVEELSNKIQALLPIREHGANWGIFHVKAALGHLSVRPPRRNIARALQVISGAHYERRRRGLPLTRRQYDVTVPMALWHIDSYDKLAMYGLRIHGCIDGASHYVLYAVVAADKTQETLFEPFRAAVQKFGTPLRVRSDFAAEHVLIREYMEEARADTRNPFLVASSVHNQRIKHWWRYLWEKVIWYYKNAFKEMVTQGFFIPDDPYQRASFIAIFLPILQEVVDEYVGVWNTHLVRQINENGRFRPSHVPARYFCEFERLHGWTSHVQDMHIADDLQHMGTQDLGPPGPQTWRTRRRALEPTLYQIPCLPGGLSTLRELAYARGRVGKDSLQCFHLHFLLSYYCHLAHESHLYVNQVNIVDHSSESRDAYALLVELAHTAEDLSDSDS